MSAKSLTASSGELSRDASSGGASSAKPDTADLERALQLIQASISARDLSDADRKAWVGLAGIVEASVIKAREQRSARSVLIDRIEDAIIHRSFKMVYQPIVEISSGMTIGFEALSRFAEADPNTWFDDAEDVGLRVALELAAIDEALHSDAWDMLRENGFLTVNASPSTVMSPLLAAALDRADLRRLVVELTEDTPIKDPDALRAGLQPLRERGLRLAVDDTGAGYASLKVILQLRPDLIKFDQFFVNDIECDPARRALFAASVEFAHATGARVVAEGVETPAQLLILQQLGVHLAQGYLLGPPSS